MECNRIGIIGCGTIGRLLALHIRDNLKRQYVLAAVASRTHGHAARLGEELGVPVLSPQRLLPRVISLWKRPAPTPCPR